MDNERFCPVCGGRIVGRSDKKFCCDNCRSEYHNSLRASEDRLLMEVSRPLRRNWRILERAVRSGEKRIRVETLSLQHFDFVHFTSFRKRILRPTLYSCHTHCYYFKNGYLYLCESNKE